MFLRWKLTNRSMACRKTLTPGANTETPLRNAPMRVARCQRKDRLGGTSSPLAAWQFVNPQREWHGSVGLTLKATTATRKATRSLSCAN